MRNYNLKMPRWLRDLEAREAYLHERKLTAKKINKQREKRRNSSTAVYFHNRQQAEQNFVKTQRSQSAVWEQEVLHKQQDTEVNSPTEFTTQSLLTKFNASNINERYVDVHSYCSHCG